MQRTTATIVFFFYVKQSNGMWFDDTFSFLVYLHTFVQTAKITHSDGNLDFVLSYLAYFSKLDVFIHLYLAFLS